MVSTFLLGLNGFDVEFQNKGIGLFHGLFHTTAITHIFHLFIFIISAFIIQLNGFYPRKVWTEKYSSFSKIMFSKFDYFNSYILNKMAEQFRIIEYPLILLFVIIGGVFLISSSDLISIFLAIELQSYGLYILCTVYRNSEKATSAGLTYFLLGGLSSCLILLASGLLYGNSGNTSFDAIYIINNINIANENMNNSLDIPYIGIYNSNYINISLIIMSVGFLFKVTAAPFHFWSPDVYDAIPTIVTTFVAIFAKISIFILLLELVHYTSNSFSLKSLSSNEELLNISWTFTLLVSSLLSLVIGSVLGLTQFRIKRLYAYSTISHVGFILLALTINSIESIQSFIFYLIQYSLSNLNAFVILITIGYSLYFYVEKTQGKFGVGETSIAALNDRKNSPIQLTSQLKGYFYINPVLALSLAITIFSFVGIPPLVGFFAKQMVLSSALDNGYVFMALIAILTSVISACYYLALIKQIFFNKTDYVINSQLKAFSTTGNIINTNSNKIIESVNISANNVVLSSSLTATISILTLMILLFILNPQEWLNMANILALIIFNC
jgi:NADH-ubiquinone oxidoreductase chain 2